KAEDRARLKPLVAALQAEGFDVWWDAHIGGGTDWREEIQQHLDAARCVIVAWSERSVGSEGHFVRDEATRAKRRGSYVPICLDDVESPLGFGEVQALSLVGWKGKRTDPRFIALVNAVNAHLTRDAPVVRQVAVADPKISRRTVMAGGVGALAVAGAGGWALLKPGAAAASTRIAVMSFSNMSGDPGQAYFSDGIAEELRGALSRVGMQVIGKASCDAVKDLEIPAAAAKLGVANILTGSVRRSPETIRVAAQLVGGKDGVEKWAQNYDRAPGDTIKIQTDIATQVAGALSIALGAAKSAALTLGGTTDPVAEDMILQSWRTLDRADSFDAFRRALALAEAAITRDPGYAGAFLAKSSVHRNWADAARTFREATEQRAQAYAAARNAIAIAPTWGRAYSVLSEVEMARLDFASALRATEHAIALSPDEPFVVVITASIVGNVQNVEAGLRLADRAIALDPLRAAGYSSKAFLLTFARKYREAIETGRKALSLRPEEISNHAQIGDAFLLFGQPARAKAEYESTNEGAIRASRLAILAARTGDRSGAMKLLAEMKRAYGAGTSYQHAEIHAQLGDLENAFAELDAAVRWGDGGLVYLKFDPFLDPIRRDPRYAALLTRLKFPT
ncbi:MAG: TIR domain-containing protein, partial [Sphingomicrobium sp.]